MVKAKGLGRGLDALLLSGEEDVQKNEGTLQTLLISELQPGKYQPRSIMQEEALTIYFKTRRHAAHYCPACGEQSI